MTKAKQKAKAALRKRRMTFGDLARVADLALSTVHAVLNNENSSPKSKRAIVNALGVEIWPGVVPNEARIQLPAGTIFAFPNISEADAFAAEIGGSGEQRGCEIRITENSAMILRDNGASGYHEEQQLDEMAASTKPGDILEICSPGHHRPGSAFAPNDTQISAAAAKAKDTQRRSSKTVHNVPPPRSDCSPS